MRPVASGLLRCVAAACLAGEFVSALQDVTLCGQYENVTDPSNRYQISTNVWGLDSSGSSCVDIQNNATTFSTTWSWTANNTLVHAYPNINYNPVQTHPIRMSNLSSLDVKVSWTMKPEISTSDSTFDTKGLAVANAKTNVAFDVFFDTQLEKAVNTTAPSYEVMVWIGSYGSILPIGVTGNEHYDVRKLPTQRIGKEKFTLYQGENDNGQYVFTWVSSTNRTEFEGDISPLVHYLWRHGMVLAANYIGVIQFGTEQKHATSNVTFTVDEFAINATRGTPKGAATSSKGLPRLEYVYAMAIFLAAFNVWIEI